MTSVRLVESDNLVAINGYRSRTKVVEPLLLFWTMQRTQVGHSIYGCTTDDTELQMNDLYCILSKRVKQSVADRVDQV